MSVHFELQDPAIKADVTNIWSISKMSSLICEITYLILNQIELSLQVQVVLLL